tara:strand:- start:3577 stop:3864 length:288 start_codon:yes stop_codon:yes gene_type:complete
MLDANSLTQVIAGIAVFFGLAFAFKKLLAIKTDKLLEGVTMLIVSTATCSLVIFEASREKLHKGVTVLIAYTVICSLIVGSVSLAFLAFKAAFLG